MINNFNITVTLEFEICDKLDFSSEQLVVGDQSSEKVECWSDGGIEERTVLGRG